MTSRPHDALFKAAFEDPSHAAGLLRGMLPEDLASSIAWGTLSPEAGSFVDRALADSHSDLLFSASLRSGERALLYLLLEHQSSNDPDMPKRMLEYLLRVWDRHRAGPSAPLPMTIPLVLSHAPEGWTAPRSLGEMFSPRPETIPSLATHVPGYTLLVDDLRQVDDEALRRRALDAFPKLALWLLRDGRDTERLLRGLADWVDAFHEAWQSPNGASAVARLLRYVALVTGDLRYEDFYATIVAQIPETEEVVMTIAEQLRAEGREQGLAEGLEQGLEQGLERGLEQGLEQGREQARAQVLARLLRARFGALPEAYAAHIEAAGMDALDRYLDRLLSASTLEAVFNDA
ncbi:Rpn family recombination-promoting nuclease/putative transposase [Pseudenhygromyxa sp. WMMC2535]|uniref:Rpn family recombination-promoting nuclease/putative transposase n=1 Tax=Pseudenhygromyxa sp. WMMC2535 TaxID=2712867 RepID=UPI00155665DD|nr:Rpn family recombination-promoting nuclease/putative transposase [Pseudenhygromyxa sp. WMMC2535]NVB41316.1 Rpn family recombination-promoting nuclease/putative transposase [Pseudenhygromyxa sp. WMMC2535]